jgi:hypothetical protein
MPQWRLVPEAPMAFQLDHVFILCDRGAPEADALVRLGIREGSGNTHPGQGTACRRFFFSNVYLELLWVEDAAEAAASRSGGRGCSTDGRCGAPAPARSA